MQAADYRLVRSQITGGIMIPTKRDVFPGVIDKYFSSWLYGEQKTSEQIAVSLPRSDPCFICDDHQRQKNQFSLLTVDLRLFQRSLPLFNTEQLSILYSLLDDDRQSYQYLIRQQYLNYRQQLIELYQLKSNQRNIL